MSNKKLENGSAHLIITVILAVALLGLVGFELYKNYILSDVNSESSNASTKTKTDNSSTKTIPSQIALTEIASDRANDTNLAIKYPNTWSATHETAPAGELVGPNDTNTITSPDGTTSVVLHTFSATGRGLFCSDNGNEDAKVNVNDKADIPGYFGMGFVNYSEVTNGGYIGAYNLDAVKNGQGCRAFSEARYLLGYTNKILATLEVKFTGSVDMSSDNYKIAKRIVQSLYKKTN